MTLKQIYLDKKFVKCSMAFILGKLSFIYSWKFYLVLSRVSGLFYFYSFRQGNICKARDWDVIKAFTISFLCSNFNWEAILERADEAQIANCYQFWF